MNLKTRESNGGSSQKGNARGSGTGSSVSATGHSPNSYFLKANTIDLFALISRDSIVAHVWYGLQTILA